MDRGIPTPKKRVRNNDTRDLFTSNDIHDLLSLSDDMKCTLLLEGVFELANLSFWCVEYTIICQLQDLINLPVELWFTATFSLCIESFGCVPGDPRTKAFMKLSSIDLLFQVSLQIW